MTNIRLDDVTKIYPFAEVSGLFGRKKQRARLEEQRRMPFTTNEGIIAVQHFSAEIADGEFVVLLGPSGCGKTTLLRLVAGLETPTLGTVYFDGRAMNDRPPEEHDVAMVFQNYSLYPHMSVFDNIAFPLRTLHLPRAEVESTVHSTAELLHIETCLKRLPFQLSGGQLQRVAIARALVRRPKVFLFDEPFSNLDAPLRAALRAEIKQLHAALGTTFLYVTHDQTEALCLGTRILVLENGRIAQDGTPAEIYNRPASLYVASFVGSLPMNLWNDLPVAEDGCFQLLGQTLRLTQSQRRALGDSRTLCAGIRPVHVALAEKGLPATVEYAEALGADTVVHLKAGDVSLAASTAGGGPGFRRGQPVFLNFSPSKLHLFGPDGSRLE